MLQKTFNRAFIIISVGILISFVVTSGCYWSKIVKTAISLDSISRQIASLEESQKFVAPGHEWNDEATSKYDELIAKRLEIYHSEDHVVSNFANLSNGKQALIILVMVLHFLMAGFCSIVLFLRAHNKCKK